MLRTMRFLFLLGFLVVTLSCSTADEPEPAAESAPRFEFDPALPWLNVSRSLTLEELHGKVVILDFWTYGCINCIHVLEDLKRLEHKYPKHLAVIGVHSPKFDNEQNLEALRYILVRYDIEHPVVNDVEFSIGRYYGMRAWPTQIVIDPEGVPLGKVTGEGNFELLDEVIAREIDKHRDSLNASPLPVALEKQHLAASLLAAPGKIAVSDRYVAISDTLHHRIILTDRQGRIQTVYGGMQAGKDDGGPGTARFFAPQGLAFTDQGLLVADTGNHLIRYIDLAHERVETLAGDGTKNLPRFGEYDAKSVGLRSPWGLALKGNRLYIAMAGSHQIWVLALHSGKLSRYAGSGLEGIDDGDLHRSSFSQPSGLSIHGDSLWVADAEDSAVRLIHLDTGQVETMIGKGLFDFGDRDGNFETAVLQHVLGIAALDKSRVLIADTYNHKLKLLNLKTKQVTSLAGTGQPGRGDDAGKVAQMNEPGGLAILGESVLITDTNNNRILEYDLESNELKQWPLTQE